MDVDAFIARWASSGGAERANYVLFLSELCRMLGVPEPDPTVSAEARNAYVFEKPVREVYTDGQTTTRFLDLYRRGCFVLEAKQGVEAEIREEQAGRPRKTRKGHGTRGTGGWDGVMRRAKEQAERYARLLPPEEGRPPFLIVVDVGHVIELYSEFTRTGGSYLPFPGPRQHRFALEDLRREEVRELLRTVWLDPLSLDPSKHAARVTRKVAGQLAQLSRSLEERRGPDGAPLYSPPQVGGFLTRMIFTMFAEDMNLLPKGKFIQLLERLQDAPEQFSPALEDLWRVMATGGYSGALFTHVLRFNGGLFEQAEALEVTAEELALLLEAARANWAEVEPAIFGTLVERALDPTERHKLGAHYTPRAYVERLVNKTVLEPLRDDWLIVQAQVQRLLEDAKPQEAVRAVKEFHTHLREVRVLDPACGTGNFLYVSLELMKRLEGEVLDTLTRLGGETPLLDVDPHQFMGLEVNPRAAGVAELVLWIGYLQWYARTHGKATPPEPILKAFKNIQVKDAVLNFSGTRPKVDKDGQPVRRWDGQTTKRNPTTGREVPDPEATVGDVEYLDARPRMWPDAEFIVGNPPFLGKGEAMRFALGDGYVETLWRVYGEMPRSADFVMFWWYKAAQLAEMGRVRRFGFVTTNSLKQTFNRRVVEKFVGQRLSLVYAIPDHPWVDTADGAAVRIAMTVGQAGRHEGVLERVAAEEKGEHDEYAVTLSGALGKLNTDLSLGADVAGVGELRANERISSNGVMLAGSGFIVTPEQAAALGLGSVPGLERHIREYRNGRDLTGRPRGVMVIDLFGLTAQEVRERFPAVYQHVLEHVKPERDSSRDAGFRAKWWIHGRPRSEFRPALAGLARYIATVETSKHRFFTFLDAGVLPDHMLIPIASDDAYHLGVLSSRVHVVWALAQGGRLGMGNDPRYNKTRCFETFPFPDASEEQKARIRDLAERLDAHRKRQLEAHPKLSMTGMYNVLEQLRAGQPLDDKAREVNAQGLVSTLLELHSELDAAVLGAYNWPHAITDAAVLEHLAALNAERAHEERSGQVRWLRRDYQAPEAGVQGQLDVTVVQAEAPVEVRPFPGKMADQAREVRRVLQLAGRPLTSRDVARAFKGGRPDKVEDVLEMLVDMGIVRLERQGETAITLFAA